MEQYWHEAKRRVGLELHRIREVTNEIRQGTSQLAWQGRGADRFRERTERRLRELSDLGETMELLLTLINRAATEVERRSSLVT